MKFSTVFAATASCLSLCSLSNAAITVVSYTPLSGINSSYPDTGGIELTDGITDSAAWSIPATTITGSDVVALSGWLNRNPSILFTFADTETVNSFTVWMADSDGAAGVALPSSVTLRTPDNSFTQTFAIDAADYPGNGFTRPLTFDGFSVSSSQLIVSATRASEWTMFSEVQFDSIPEPTSCLLLSLSALLCLRRSRIQLL